MRSAVDGGYVAYLNTTAVPHEYLGLTGSEVRSIHYGEVDMEKKKRTYDFPTCLRGGRLY